MTPKDKALELIGKMCLNNCTETNINRMINPCLIAVDEIIKVFYFINPNSEDLILLEELNYWKEVKEEINNL